MDQERTVKVPNPTTRAPFGRPPIDQAVARSERVVTFVTKNERAVLVRLARDNKVSVSATCHLLLSNAIKKLKQK